MPTDSENTNNNPSEALNANDDQLSPQLTNDVRGVTYGLTYDAVSVARPPSPIAPNGLIFETAGISNGYASRVNGITDFTAYNDYIHYTPIGLGGVLSSAGVNNVNGGGSARFNVYNSLVRASFRFEIYNRQYRI